MGEDRGKPEGSLTVGDLVSISRAPAVVSLADLEALRGRLSAGEDGSPQLADLLVGYHLGDPDTKAAFDALLRSLGRPERRGDAFIVQGVYGSGKSHLLAALALLCGHPAEAWPVFLRAHPEYQHTSASFTRPRLLVAVPLDEYPPRTHSLEHIVLSALEKELARRHGIRVALTEESHLLDLVDRYVVPQAAPELQETAQAETGTPWRSLREDSPEQAARVALTFIEQSGFPLDWRRSRAEAWGALRRALEQHDIDGPVLLLDELSMFLAGKDLPSLNADASFLQYLAQRSGAERCWLVCVTQRGLEEVGDIDRRTLRQMRDRFRPPFTLDLSELGWIVEHRLAQKRDGDGLHACASRLHAQLGEDACFTPEEIERTYPLNPLCLSALQRAAEAHLSRTRSIIRMLQEAAHERGWLELPASRLLTPDAAFDLVRDETADSPAGQRHLHAHELVEANAARILPGREPQLLSVMKTLLLLSLAGLRWTPVEIRSSLVGCREDSLWREPEAVEEALGALYRWGAYVERSWSERDQAHAYFVDVSSDASERIRQRINELVGEFRDADPRVARAALAACHEPGFPLAGLEEPRGFAVDWWNARRLVSAVCRDVEGLTSSEVGNLLGLLASPETRDDGRLFVAMPATDTSGQEKHWQTIGVGLGERFAPAVLGWFPASLTEDEWLQLAEHAALARMVADRTFAGRREAELRQKLRERWLESEAFTRQIVPRAYYRGRIVDLKGALAVEPERLGGMAGQWEEVLAAAFSGAFRYLFPRFPSVAPERKLAGRAQTNQIIDQFIRPGQASLPPASALEAHLRAYAAPLGLVEGDGREPRLALNNAELVTAAIAAAPPASEREEVAPEHAIRFLDLAGKLAKSEWGLIREQSELLIAALIRTGHLVALDAFLQPTRLDAIAAPLADNLPYVMRGRPLTGAAAHAASCLWSAATGAEAPAWDLPTQERAWGDLLAWARRLTGAAADRRAAIARAAETFGHPPESWSFAASALARAEAVAEAVDGTHTSRQGLADLVKPISRLPGGVEESARQLATWRACELFLEQGLQEAAALSGSLTDSRVRCPGGSLLARQRQEATDAFFSPEKLIADTGSVCATARRFLEAYRKHYLAWHGQVHAAHRFGPLARLRQSDTMEAARRLGAAGLRTDEVSVLDAALAGALARRCLVGDPLPEGSVVCPSCALQLGEELPLPDADESEARVGELLTKQTAELREHEGLLRRRLEGCGEESVREVMAKLLEAACCRAGVPAPAGQVATALADDVVLWIRHQLGQPKAKRRALADLEQTLRGQETAKRQVVGQVEDWLAAADDEIVEIV